MFIYGSVIRQVLKKFFSPIILGWFLICFYAFVNFANSQTTVPKTAGMPILFELAKSDLNPIYLKKLDSFAIAIIKWVDYRVYLYGYTDSSGSKEYNDTLSLRRVNTVQNYLISKGLNASWFKVNAYGEERPKYANDTLHQHLNRRVDMVVKYGLKQPMAEVTPKKSVKSKPVVTHKVKNNHIPGADVSEPIVAGDTVLGKGTGMEVIISRVLFDSLMSHHAMVNHYYNEKFDLHGLSVFENGMRKFTFDKKVTYRYLLPGPIDKSVADTLWYLEIDKNGLSKKVVGKVKVEKKKDGYWLKFSTRWIPGGGDEFWWARLRTDNKPEYFYGNTFELHAAGYRINSISIRMDGENWLSVPYTRLSDDRIYLSNYIGTNPWFDKMFTWDELSGHELEITLTGKNGKRYIVNKNLMELTHTMSGALPEFKESRVHMHKDGCGHPGLTGGRLLFFRIRGNSHDLATLKVIPPKFTIMPNDMIDISTMASEKTED